MEENIVLNPDFSQGVQFWHANCCNAIIVSPESRNAKVTSSDSENICAAVTGRTECWQGLEQDITSRVHPGVSYKFSACVGVYGCDDSSNVQATLRLEYRGSNTQYLFIGRVPVSNGKWETLEGSFTLSSMPDRVVFYLEGPSPGVELLIKSVVISCSSANVSRNESRRSAHVDENIILNPRFENGLSNWSERCSKLVLRESMLNGTIVSQSGSVFAAATDRAHTWNGIQQDITERVQRKLAYEVTAVVRVHGNNVNNADVRATLWVQTSDRREEYIGISRVKATDKEWSQLHGKFTINGVPSNVVIYLEGPPAGSEILVDSFTVKRAQRGPLSSPIIEYAAFGANIIQNSELIDGTNGWFPLGNCKLGVSTGSPHFLPLMANETLGSQEPLSGRYIFVTNRTHNWMGPAQIITDMVKLFVTYQVSAWVKVGARTCGPQSVSVALSVDGQWVNGGQVVVNDDGWHEIGGSFRIEKPFSKVMVHVQGPGPGVDLMVAAMRIFAVDRRARFDHLRRKTDEIRKRDIVLKITGLTGVNEFGSSLRVRQTANSFPLGSCICRSNLDNEEFVTFFKNNFNWAVFGNELKWYWTEPQPGKFNYKDADEMLDWCMKNNIETRGHCIFWDVDDSVQSWVKNLDTDDLMKVVHNRLTDLLTRYKGKFRHYDVNNEMLHGSFFPDRLGHDIRAYMFKAAHKLDPFTLLFVNDYHVEDCCDSRSSPEKYIEQVLDLQEQGAPIGGVGIQGHIHSPIGSIICSALDKLSILGLPIWFTELDVSSVNEHVRADDLEVTLREAYAHPGVEGVMLWGFWELFMSREHSHLVNAEGDLNEAGERFLKLKREWLTYIEGRLDDQGQFSFRGFHGTYEVDIVILGKTVTKTFVVDKGNSPLVVNLNLENC